jgi:hypothetical protein
MSWIDSVKNSMPEHVASLERSIDHVMTHHSLTEEEAHGCALAAAIASGNGPLAMEIAMNGPLFGNPIREVITQSLVNLSINNVHADFLDIIHFADIEKLDLKLEEVETEDDWEKAGVYALTGALVLKYKYAFVIAEHLKNKGYTAEQLHDIANISSVIAAIGKVII